ncbi:NADH dehydrogenase [ubiquinone] 1 alpha subcomplex assembly factor 7 [Amorphus suaedae]
MTTPLAARLTAEIAETGPITVADYMARCLGDPHDGYYTTRIPFGSAGDFVTAPEVSQIFGELIGAWLLAVWDAAGAPAPVRLVELGPGLGTLMADILRVAALRPAFLSAIRVDLVETSPVLRAAQAERLADAPCPLAWHDRVEDVPEGPALVIANEFFDALPIRQFVRTRAGWGERMVGIDADGRLAFGVGPGTLPAAALAAFETQPEGTILEVQPVGDAIMTGLASRIARDGGALLAIDYGYAAAGTGDTLQAMRAHAFADPLAEPGAADLTAHVNFAALAAAAKRAGAAIHGPITQGAFLLGLGLVERAQRLAAGKDEAAFRSIEADVGRLAGADQMGELFKVLAVTPPGLLPPPFASGSA